MYYEWRKENRAPDGKAAREFFEARNEAAMTKATEGYMIHAITIEASAHNDIRHTHTKLLDMRVYSAPRGSLPSDPDEVRPTGNSH